ncbi:unnamed protein product [Closterium sp. Naga37s-1]|nr:unnamed protein product [Closterium sp. Naga37s-1]
MTLARPLPPCAHPSHSRQSVWAAAIGILLLAGARAAVAQTGDHVSKSAVTVADSTSNKASPNGNVSSSSLVRNAAGGATKKVVGGEGEEGEGEVGRGQEGERRELRGGQGGEEQGREEEREGAEEEAEMGRAYSRWVEKPASLSVPLRVVALRGTVASMWRKDFLLSQSGLAKLTVDVRPSHAAIASDLLAPLPTTTTTTTTTTTPAAAPSPSAAPSSVPSTGQKKAWGKKGRAQPSLRSAAAADVVTVGDRWLKELIARGALLPLDGVERSDWFKALGPTWLRLLDRTPSGHLTLPDVRTSSSATTTSTSGSSSREGGEGAVRGKVYAVPYRMGYLAVAWRPDRLQQQGVKPIQVGRGDGRGRSLVLLSVSSYPCTNLDPTFSSIHPLLFLFSSPTTTLCQPLFMPFSLNPFPPTTAAHPSPFLHPSPSLSILHQTWNDLWQPALRGQVAVIDSPRELLAVTMRSLGASFNAHSPLDAHVPGGMPALKARWQALLHQIRVCDSSNYLKAFQASDVLVVVGWSSDLLPFARRNNNITVAAPADGTLLFADLWAVPATARYNIPKAAWRNRGPSPLIGQWMKFCLQPARAVPLEREIFSAFSPTAELNQVLLGDKKGGGAAQGQTMQGRVKQAIEAVGLALDKVWRRG